MPAPAEGYLGVLGRLAQTFAGGAPDGAKHVWQGVAPWLQQLGLSASTRWLPHLVLGIPCEVAELGQPCQSAACAACAACHRPCCAGHSFADKDASVVCYVCVNKLVKEAQPKIPGEKPPGPDPRAREHRSSPPPPGPQGQQRPKNRYPPEAYAQARRVLGVKRSASPADIERAYKKLLVRWHPDKFPPDKRADAEARFKEVRVAYDFLKDHPE